MAISAKDYDKNEIPQKRQCASLNALPTNSSQETIQDQNKVKPSFGHHLQKKVLPTQRSEKVKKDGQLKMQKCSFKKKKPGQFNVAKEVKFMKRKQNECCKDIQSNDKQNSLHENVSIAVAEPQFHRNTQKCSEHHEKNPESALKANTRNFKIFKDSKKKFDGKILIDKTKISSLLQDEDDHDVFEQTLINYRLKKIFTSDSGFPLAAQNQNLCLSQDDLRNPRTDAETLQNVVQSNKSENSIAVNLAMEILLHASATDSDFLSRLNEMDLDLIDFESQMKAPKVATKRNEVFL